MNKDFKNSLLKRFSYSLEDLASCFGVRLESARVIANRKVKSGQLVRVKRDLYMFNESFESLNEAEIFRLASLIQTPSCISFCTALSYYGITTQIYPFRIESLNPIRTKHYKVKNLEFSFFYSPQKYYFGFERVNNFFIAKPEKALLDCLYFLSLGRYSLDVSSLELAQINWKFLQKISKDYPVNVKQFIRDWRIKHESL